MDLVVYLWAADQKKLAMRAEDVLIAIWARLPSESPEESA
jgi:hypothetical protein